MDEPPFLADATIRYVGPRHIVRGGDPVPVPFWPPGRSFEGMTVTLIGGGPSHADIDLSILKGHPFIAINSACRKVRPIATDDDILYFSDNSWAERFDRLLRTWPGPIVTSNRNAKARLGALVRRLEIEAITREIQIMSDRVQASSGHTAACLAVIMGARRIVLCGFECRALGGKTHGHGDYQLHDLSVFDERFLPGWRALAVAFAERGVEVINATPESSIIDFPFASLAEALE